MKSVHKITLSLLAAASLVVAQDTNSGGWKPIGGSASGQAPAIQNTVPPGDPPQAATAAPPQLNLKAGTYVTVRVNQKLSSDKNQTGDTFTAMLVRPLVVDGFVVAQPSQTFGGRVAEATRANQAHGISHLGLQLTDLMFVDGQHAPIQSELVAVSGPPSIKDTTVNTGAAGATPGVLLTHGKATVIGPETVLTFKIDSDVSITTANAPQAFRPVGPSDYAQVQARPGYGYAPGSAYAAGYPYYGYPYGYPYYGCPYYPYYWGPGVGLYFGGGWGPGFGFRGRFR